MGKEIFIEKSIKTQSLARNDRILCAITRKLKVKTSISFPKCQQLVRVGIRPRFGSAHRSRSRGRCLGGLVRKINRIKLKIKLIKGVSDGLIKTPVSRVLGHGTIKRNEPLGGTKELEVGLEFIITQGPTKGSNMGLTIF